MEIDVTLLYYFSFLQKPLNYIVIAAILMLILRFKFDLA